MSCWEEPSPSRLSSKAEDCAYEGKIEFRGPNKGDLLELSRTSAQRELRELATYQYSGITIEGRGSHRVYVLRKQEGE